jgi:YHS domain-containing protein
MKLNTNRKLLFLAGTRIFISEFSFLMRSKILARDRIRSYLIRKIRNIINTGTQKCHSQKVLWCVSPATGTPGWRSKREHTHCIPGAPDIDLCHHCTGCSAEVRIKASNSAGAALGDLAYVSHNPGKVIKNVLSLLGIPLIVLMLGTAIGVILYQGASVHETGASLAASTGIFLGIMLGMRVYGGGSGDNQPLITRIEKAAMEAASSHTVDPVCKMEVKESTASARLTYEGVTYYFCNPSCLKAFTKDPSRYVEGKKGPQ